MSKSAGYVRQYALGVTLLLTAVAVALCVYAVIQIEHERTAQCLAQNARHRNTVRQLDESVAALEVHASRGRRAQLEASKAFTLLLINQLAPLQTCGHLTATKSKPTHRRYHP